MAEARARMRRVEVAATTRSPEQLIANTFPGCWRVAVQADAGAARGSHTLRRKGIWAALMVGGKAGRGWGGGRAGGAHNRGERGDRLLLSEQRGLGARLTIWSQLPEKRRPRLSAWRTHRTPSVCPENACESGQ